MKVPEIHLDKVSQVFVGVDGISVQALQNLSCEIQKNEFIAVVGPSGCGKSTVLRLIAGLILPTEGRVSLDGNQITDPPDKVGIVFQKPTLLPWLDVISNVTFPMRHKYGRVRKEEYRLAQELLELVGLHDFASKRPNELSGGMQQRAAIARALLLDPEILLMDEPFSALDALSRDEMGFELLRIWADRPKTVVFITHSIPEAVLLADRVMVMTPRPGSLHQIIEVPLPRPRGIETLSNPLLHQISNDIRSIVMGYRNAT